jgi:hypothetical protein
VRRAVLHIVVAASALAGATVLAPLASAAPTASAVGPGSTYVSLPVPQRLVDTRTGAANNHKGAVAGGHGISPLIAGRGGVPATATAVAATISAVGPTADGGIVGYVGNRPGTSNLQFSTGHSASDTAILQLSGGRLNLFNQATRGTVQIVLDVSGYYVAGASSTDPGSYHSVAPARVVNTITGAGGNHKGALAAGRGITPAIGANGGIPASAGAVVVTIGVVNAKSAGTIIGYRPDEPKQSLALLHFVPGPRATAFAVLRLSGGRVNLVNTSGGTVDVTVDVMGYYDIGFAQAANTFQTVIQSRVHAAAVGANASVAIPVAGEGGVPLTGVAAVLVTLHVGTPSQRGGLQVYEPGQPRPSLPTVLQFAAKQTTSNIVFAPVSAGKIEVHNSSAGSTTLVVDVDGYVPSTAVAAPTTKATARYVRNIDGGSGDAATMTAEGKADAAAGDTFVLLDIGAQSNDKSGVVLSATGTKLTYTQLVTALNGYLVGFGTAGHTGRVAVATNNSGDWTAYSSSARGSDWATKVVASPDLKAPAGVSVIGAADFEAGFASDEPQAESWKTNFLAKVPGSGDALVFIGSADFCPKTWTADAACNFNWTYQKLYGLAGGSRTVALPQVYFGYMATEWAEINASGGGKLRFLGALTEFASDNGSLEPVQGYAALSRAVASITTTPIGSMVADLRIDA